jgi:hypothetical protein
MTAKSANVNIVLSAWFEFVKDDIFIPSAPSVASVSAGGIALAGKP